MFIAFLLVLPLVVPQIVNNGPEDSVRALESASNPVVNGQWTLDGEGNWIYIPSTTSPEEGGDEESPLNARPEPDQQIPGQRPDLGGSGQDGGGRIADTPTSNPVLGGVANEVLSRSPPASAGSPLPTNAERGQPNTSGGGTGLPAAAPAPNTNAVPNSPNNRDNDNRNNDNRSNDNNGRGGPNNGQNPGSNNGQNPGSNNGQNPGGNNGQNPGGNNGPNPGGGNGQNPGGGNGQNPGGNNRNAAATPDSSGRQRSLLAAILISIIGSLLLLSALVAFIIVRRRHRNRSQMAELGNIPPRPHLTPPVRAHVTGIQHEALPPIGRLPPIIPIGRLEDEEKATRSIEPTTGYISTIPLTIPVAQRLRERDQQTFIPRDEVQQEFMQGLQTTRRNTSTPVIEEKAVKEEIQVFYIEEEVDEQVEMLEVEEEEEEERVQTRGRQRRVFEEYLIEEVSGSASTASDVEIVEHIVDEDMDDAAFHEYLSNLSIPGSYQTSRPTTGSSS